MIIQIILYLMGVWLAYVYIDSIVTISDLANTKVKLSKFTRCFLVILWPVIVITEASAELVDAVKRIKK